ncbi:hypothetical protein [Kluyvera sp. CHPC 1.251]|uniref:hypothetical protein n=1 Tax=Kluyvera sp. CHPC 1.251 TaxID=2995175 RepID=UPI002FD800E8
MGLDLLEICVRDTHISYTANDIGVHFGKNIANIAFDTTGIYQVQSPTNAHIRFGSDFTSLTAIALVGLSFRNFNSLDNVLQVFSDPNLYTLAFVRGGGSVGVARDKKFEYVMLSDGNLTG